MLQICVKGVAMQEVPGGLYIYKYKIYIIHYILHIIHFIYIISVPLSPWLHIVTSVILRVPPK